MSRYFCPYCGQPHRDTAKFCPVTGKILSSGWASGAPSSPRPVSGLTGRLPTHTILNNRFIILRKIGEGGMAAVYQAADTQQSGVMWAIKEMSESAITNPQERAQRVRAFQQEAALLQQLQHPNLPRVVAYFSKDERHYLAMEYVDGQTLETLLAQRATPFSETEIIPWVTQLCDVLYYLHTQPRPIIFRDLKPSNIMVTATGQIKLIDFGIVRFFKPGKSKDTIAIGTPGYAAPEATSGQTNVRSDVYSLCVVIHELLTKHDPTTTIWSIPPARQLNSNISNEWERILQRGLANKRERRWQDMQTLKNAFLQTASGQANISHPLSYPVREPKPITIPAKTSRPTTRLIMAAAQLSTGQLSIALGVVTLAIIICTWLLAPVLIQYPVIWNNLAAIAFVAPFTHAAVPRRWIAGIAHSIITLGGGLTIALRFQNISYSIPLLLIGTLVSAIFIEIWLRFLPNIKGTDEQNAWKSELVWYSIMAVLATTILYQIEAQRGFSVLLWINAAIIGAAGWFFGDMLYQYLNLRQLRQIGKRQAKKNGGP